MQEIFSRKEWTKSKKYLKKRKKFNVVNQGEMIMALITERSHMMIVKPFQKNIVMIWSQILRLKKQF